MIYRHKNKFAFAIALAVGVTAAVAMFAEHSRAQLQTLPGQTPPTTGEQPPVVRVGTYNPQAAFEAHPAQEELMEAFNQVQTQMMQAQEAGDQQQMQQLQQGYEQKRNQIVERFQREVNEVLPVVAEAAGIKVVALQVVYSADDAQVRDLTPHLVGIFTQEEEQEEALPPTQHFPNLPN